jgi:hypothetical protein
MRIIAAVEPMPLVMEKTLSTVSGAAFMPGAASPEAPAKVTPEALPVMPMAKGTLAAATESSRTFWSARSPACADDTSGSEHSAAPATAAACCRKSRRARPHARALSLVESS